MEEKKTPGRKPAVSKEDFDKLVQKVDKLEACVAKLAHYSGGNRILDEHSISRWEPQKQDMSKYKE